MPIKIVLNSSSKYVEWDYPDIKKPFVYRKAFLYQKNKIKPLL